MQWQAKNVGNLESHDVHSLPELLLSKQKKEKIMIIIINLLIGHDIQNSSEINTLL